MKIAIIGSGNVGLALAKGWTQAGHDVVFGVRNPHSAKAQIATEGLPDAKLKTIAEAAAFGEVLVITTPPEAVVELVPQLGQVHNKVLIDTTNAIRNKPDPYPTAYHALKALLGTEHVVKCFNTTGFENMANPVYKGEGIDMFMAGGSPHAKSVTQQLAHDLGFGACWDFGGDDNVQLQEQWALCWINLAIMQGYGRDLALKVVRR